MKPLDTRTAELVRRLRVLPGPAERLAVLVERADRLPGLSTDEKNAENLVPGCVSRVWLCGGVAGGVVRLRGEAESGLVKGLVTLLWEIADGLPAPEVAAAGDAVPAIAELGLEGQISPTRLRGLTNVWRRMREIAGARTGAEVRA